MKLRLIAASVGITTLFGLGSVPVASAAEQVGMKGEITVSSAISCEASVTTESSSIDLLYTVNQEEMDGDTPGTFSNTGAGTADYVASAGKSGNCPVNALTIKLPAFPLGAGTFAHKIAGAGGQWFLSNTYLADLMTYTTPDATGTGQRPTTGFMYGRSADQALGGTVGGGGTGMEVFKIQSGNQPVLNTWTKPTVDQFGTSDATVINNMYLSAAAEYRRDSYSVDSYNGWPAQGRYPDLAVGYVNGASGGAFVGLQSAALTDVQSVRVSIGAVLSQAVLTGSVADTGGVVNNDSMSGAGTITFTWS